MPQKWSILDQNWPNMAGLSTFHSGPKGPKMVNLNDIVQFGTLLGPSGLLWTISDKNEFLPQMDKVGFGGDASEQNINSCLKWSKRVQMGPKGSQMFKKT